MTGSHDQKNVRTTADVAVLGCGNMGSAMVRALLASGRSVAAWNRTAARAEALAADGARVAATPADAIASAGLTILVMAASDDVRSVLAEADPAALDGRVVLNLVSGTPEDAHDLAALAQKLGIKYLDGAIGAYPEQMGTADARILVAGDEALWESHADVVRTLAGESLYAGADHGAPNGVDAALTGGFYISALVAYMEAARAIQKLGVTHEFISTMSRYSVSVLDHQIQLALGRIEAGDYTTDEATLNVYADAAATFAAVLDADGGAPIVATCARVLRGAVDAGLGDQDIAAVVTLPA